LTERPTDSPSDLVEHCLSLVAGAREAIDADPAEARNLLLAATLTLGALARVLDGLPLP
jgi:hypothetical protein